MSSPAIKGRESERHTGKKKEELGKGKTFNLCDQRLLLPIHRMTLIVLRVCGVRKKKEQWKYPINFINVNEMLHWWRKRYKILCLNTKYNIMFLNMNANVSASKFYMYQNQRSIDKIQVTQILIFFLSIRYPDPEYFFSLLAGCLAFWYALI